MEDPLVKTVPTSRDEDDGLLRAIQAYRGHNFGELASAALSSTTFLLGGAS
jgi:hypothetical protein